MVYTPSALFQRAAGATGLTSALSNAPSGFAPGITSSFNSPFTSSYKSNSDAVGSRILAASPAEKPKWDARYQHAVPHTNSYYAKCMVGGALACGVTHWIITPLDVAKCNMQVDPTKYTSTMQAIRKITAEEGFKGLWKGWAPTLIGYNLQGLFKFGLYEYFKDFYSNQFGEENSKKYKGLIYILGSLSAEFFADIALCPMEMVKVKVQTSPPGTFPVAFGPALSAMSKNAKETRYPFGSLGPLWSRQIPYTIAKFFFFEKCVAFFYNNVFTEPRESYGKSTQLTVTFMSGYSAGVICAIVSHPADSLVSQLGKASNKGKSLGQIAKEVGFMDLMTKGLGTRIIMIGTLTGIQWWIYDTYKTFTGLGTSGGK